MSSFFHISYYSRY